MSGLSARRRTEGVGTAGMTWRALAIGAALLCAAPQAARAAEISIVGRWEIVEAAAAPWIEEGKRAALNAAGKALLKLVITFSPKDVSSRHKLFTCSRVEYEATELGADAIFSGNLPEPNPTAAAQRLGFPRGDIPGVDVRCPNAVFGFHFRDPATAMIALDDVIYTLKRR